MRNVIIHGKNTFFSDIGAGEFSVGRNGITHSDKRIASNLSNRYDIDVASYEEPWLPRETEEVLEQTLANQAVLVEGDYGAGKSTLLFGVRLEMRKRGVPYTYINGHFLRRHEQVAVALRAAIRHDRHVIFDSWDYLFLARGNKRRDAERARPALLGALKEHIIDGGAVVLTSHTRPWFNANSNDELLGESLRFRTDYQTRVHKVHGKLESQSHMQRLVSMKRGPEFANVFTDRAIQSGESTAQTYRIIKILCGVLHDESPELQDQGKFDEAVRRVDHNDRQRYGLPDSYKFVPTL